MDTNKKAVYWLSSAHGIIDIYSGMLSPIMPFIAAKMGFSLAIATMIISISQAIASTLQPVFGYFSDITKKRVFIFWGLFIGAIANPIAANVDHIWILLFFAILGTLGGSMYHPQALGFISKFSDKNSVFNMSLFVTMGTLGFAISPLISSVIVQFFGFRHLLFVSVLGVCMALLMFKCVPKIQNFDYKVEKDGKKILNDIFSNKIMIILFVIGMMKTLIQSSTSIMMPFLWKDMGHAPIYVGFSMFLFLFAGGMGSFVSHWFERKCGAKFVFYFSLIINFPLMIIYAMTYKNFPVFSMIIFILIGFFTAFAQPVTLVMAQKTLPQYKSIVSGIINGLTWGIVSVLLLWLGILAEEYGIINILISLSVLPVISSILVKDLPNSVEE